MSSEDTFHGGCFCRAISYKVTGSPILSGYCHCTLCQRLTGCPFVHTIHFPESAFTWTMTDPQSALQTFSPPEKPHKRRYRCKTCGVCVASHNTAASKWSIWGATLDRDAEGHIKGWNLLKPTTHMFYDTRLLDVNDELGKWAGYEKQSEQMMN